MSDTETKKLSVWEYFERCNDDKWKAECLLCHKILGCSTSHNLKHHLKCMHSDEVDVNTHIQTYNRQRNNSPNNNSTREIVRKAFTKVEGDKVAMCNFCHKILSYRTTIANLKNHLVRAHRNEYTNLLQIKTEEADDDDSDGHNKTYFEVIEDDDGSTFYNQETNDSRDDRQEKRKYEAEDGEVYTEVIYLDEEPAQKAPTKRNSSKITSQKSKKPFPKRRIMSFNETFENQSSDEDLRMEKVPVSNELDKFGQYIASLLASMPKHVCTKLQLNIVNHIVEEKLKIETENANMSAASNYGSSKNTGTKNNDLQDNSDSQNEVIDDVQEPVKKQHKYIITENAEIVKNV